MFSSAVFSGQKGKLSARKGVSIRLPGSLILFFLGGTNGETAAGSRKHQLEGTSPSHAKTRKSGGEIAGREDSPPLSSCTAPRAQVFESKLFQFLGVAPKSKSQAEPTTPYLDGGGRQGRTKAAHLIQPWPSLRCRHAPPLHHSIPILFLEDVLLFLAPLSPTLFSSSSAQDILYGGGWEKRGGKKELRLNRSPFYSISSIPHRTHGGQKMPPSPTTHSITSYDRGLQGEGKPFSRGGKRRWTTLFLSYSSLGESRGQ